jgi:hypothetical protein
LLKDTWKPRKTCVDGKGTSWELSIRVGTILKWIPRLVGPGGMELIYMVHDRDQWLDFVGAAMNFVGYMKCEEFLDNLRNC